MTTERIDIIVSERGSRVVKRNLEDLGSSARGAASGVQFLQRALATLGIGLGIAQLIRLADTYTLILNRLRLVTSGTSNLTRVNDELFESARRTRSSYEATVSLYARVARSASQLGLSQQQLIGITETINQSLRVSGATAQEAASATLQLAQAMGSGVLRGEELNAILENAPRLARAIADGLGVPIGQLRKLGEQGRITSQEVVDAIQKAAPEIAAEFAQMAPTVGDSIQVLSDSFMRLLGEIDQSLGITQGLASAILFLAQNLETLAGIAAVVATAFAAMFTASLITSIAATVSQVIALEMALGATSTASALFSAALKMAQGGVRALTAAIAANPLGLLLVSLTTIISSLYIFRDEISVTADGVVSLGDVFRAVFGFISDLISPVVDFFKKAWTDGTNAVRDRFTGFLGTVTNILSGIVDFVKDAINTYIAIWVGGYTGIVAIWDKLPSFFKDLGAKIANFFIDGMESLANGAVKALNKIIEGINDILSFIGADKAAEWFGFSGQISLIPEANLSEWKLEVTGAGAEVGEAFTEAFVGAFGVDYVGNALGAIMNRAREIAEARIAAEAADTFDPTGNGPGLGNNPGTGGRGGGDRLNDQLERMRSLLEDIKGPLNDYMGDVQALQTLLQAGAITLQEYTDKWMELRIAFLETQNTFTAGMERGLLKVYQDASNIAAQIENVLTRAFKAAEDALANFVMTGKLDFKSLVSSIIEDIARMNIQQNIIKPIAGWLGGVLGIDLSGLAGGGNGAQALNASAAALNGSAAALSSAAAALGSAAGIGGGGIGAQLAAASGAANQAASAAQTAAGSIAQTPGIFGQFLGGLQSIFGNLLSGLGSIFSSLFSGGGGGGFGFFGSLFRGIFGGIGFATGGGFTVGGQGGVDSQLVAFRASPGERVQIKRPGEDERDTSSRQQIVFNVYAQDVESFRRSETQIAARLARMQQRGRRNL